MASIFGKKLKAYRRDKSVKLYDLAKFLGISPAYLAHLETGRLHVKKYIICQIARYFQLTPEQEDELFILCAQSEEKIKIDVTQHDLTMVKTIAIFENRFPKLDESRKEKIYRILTQQE